jgi:hypothetical protein
MLLRNLNKAFITFLGAVSVMLFAATGFAQINHSFRTPAKLYAGAYSVKIQLKKGLVEYDVPMWIKPDQAESTLDPVLMRDLGFQERTMEFDRVRIAGKNLPIRKFKTMKSEWAFVPDYARSCCHGVLGRDLLEAFELTFSPASPTHIVWQPVFHEAVAKPLPMNDLKKLFSIEKEIKLTAVLNLRDRTLKFEGAAPQSEPELFLFSFIPPDREVRVMKVLPSMSAAARKAGLIENTTILEINGQDVTQMDRWVIEKYLRGEKTDQIRFLTSKKKKISYDFKSRKFE